MPNIISKLKKINIPFLFVASVHIFYSFLTDTIAYTADGFYKNTFYWLAKVFAIASVIIFWQMVAAIQANIKNKDLRRFLRFFGIYFGIMLFFLLLTWPGIWRWDDIKVLFSVTNVEFLFLQHWLTGFYYMICLCIFPFPGGILLIQIFLISLAVGFIMYKLGFYVKSSRVYFFYIPMLLPAIVSNNLYPLRLPLYSFIELFLFAHIFFKYRDKSKIKSSDIAVWAVLTALVSTWRSEGIIYLLVIPVLLLILFKKNITWRPLISLVLAATVISGSIMLMQRSGGQDDSYFITGIMQPLHGVLSTDFKSDSKEEDLKNIDKVLNIDLLANISGGAAYWAKDRQYTQEEFEIFKSTAYRLMITNIPAILLDRANIFYKTNGFNSTVETFLGYSPQLFNYTKSGNYLETSNRFKTFFLNHPPSITVRSVVVSLLDFRNPENYREHFVLFPVFYNACIPIGLLFLLMVFAIIKKQKEFVFIPLAVFGKTIITFLTAPDPLFMYYLPVYIVSFAFVTIALLTKFKEKNANE